MGCFGYLSRLRRWRRAPSSPASASTSSHAPASSAVLNAAASDSSATATRCTSNSRESEPSLPSLHGIYDSPAKGLRVFEYRELRGATNDFSRLLKVGEGGFGGVYKGLIRPPDRKGEKVLVAIKKLNRNGFQGHKQWLAEVSFLGIVEHPNLVKLIGYCAEDDEKGIQRLVVYEFIPNRTLEDHLFSKAYPPLPWNVRLEIALGAAEGLAYLHEGLEFQVIYRDFKTSNILLTMEFKPKLSDFGLAREGPTAGSTHVTTAVMGTYGYAAPEYIETGHLTSKSDVWSFGVVLYEILTGRRSMERNYPASERKLLDWVKRFPPNSRLFGRIIDPRLQNQYSINAAREVAKLANSCLLKQAKDRPLMSEVVDSLKQSIRLTEMTGPEESLEDLSTADSENEASEKKDDQLDISNTLRRRMLHLAKLNESANVVGMRKYTLMKSPVQA